MTYKPECARCALLQECTGDFAHLEQDTVFLHGKACKTSLGTEEIHFLEITKSGNTIEHTARRCARKNTRLFIIK